VMIFQWWFYSQSSMKDRNGDYSTDTLRELGKLNIYELTMIIYCCSRLNRVIGNIIIITNEWCFKSSI
jgi:hypothetical protein